MKREMHLFVGCLSVVLLFFPSARSSAQRIVIDWQARSMNCPSEINDTIDSQVLVLGVNDLLYQYQVDVAEKPRSLNDFALLGGVVGGSGIEGKGAEDSGSCEGRLAIATKIAGALGQAFAAVHGLNPAKEGELYESIPLRQTISAWRRFEAENAMDIAKLEEHHDYIKANCSPGIDWVKDLTNRERLTDWAQVQKQVEILRDWRDRTAVGLSHDVSIDQLLRPDVDYTIEVVEHYKGVDTVKGKIKFECRPASTVLTLSAGTMFSSMPVLDFKSVKAPNIATAEDGSPLEADGTRNILAVDGSSMSVHAIGMLNYRIPGLSLGKKQGRDWGLAVSSGPVFRLAGQTDASAIGYFAGVSVGLWNRLFITPGLHIGQFSDFPPNFFEGREVPDQFGALTPTKRWTGRFAVALTYRTNKLGRPAVNGTANNLPAAPNQPAELSVVTKSLPAGVAGQDYPRTELKASGGGGGLTWELTQGALPAGLEFKDGVISGKPTEAATQELKFQVKDKDGKTAVSDVLPLIITAVTVKSVGAELVFGCAASMRLEAENGTPPYIFSVVGDVPEGLALADGKITTTVNASKPASMKVTATDGNKIVSAEKELTIELRSAVTITSPATLADGVVNAQYSPGVRGGVRGQTPIFVNT